MNDRGRLLERLRERLGPLPSLRVLDLGGGDGAKTWTFAHGAAEIVVLDPDPRKRARGARRHPGIRFVDGVAESLPFEAGRFDRVASIHAFHHFADVDAVLREAHRVLVPGGRIVVVDLPTASAIARLFAALHRLGGHGRLRFRSAPELAGRMAAAGFGDVRSEELGRRYLLMGTR